MRFRNDPPLENGITYLTAFTAIHAMLDIAQAQLVAIDKRPTQIEWKSRGAILPGRIDTRIRPMRGLACKYFVEYTEVQTFMNMAHGDTTCSGQIDTKNKIYRQVNYLKYSKGRARVIIYRPIYKRGVPRKTILFLAGGPRTLTVNRPIIAELVKAGYTVVMPVYMGSIDTRHPDPDLPFALSELSAIKRWVGSSLQGVIGVSAGAYIAAASCQTGCRRIFLIAPPLKSPRQMFSDEEVDWSNAGSDICLWSYNKPNRICDSTKSYMRSFWGSYSDIKLKYFIKGEPRRVFVISSKDDTRTYTDRLFDEIKATGCHTYLSSNLTHQQIDSDKKIISYIINNI